MNVNREESFADIAANNEVGERSSALSVEQEHIRTHLPTQAELLHSKELIDQWQKELDHAEKEIVDEILCYLEYDRDSTRRDMVVKSAKEDVSATIDWCVERTRVEQQHFGFKSLRKNQAFLTKRLENERFFISPIRKLSTEIFVEIFSYSATFPAGSFYPDAPERRLALVCKNWRYILLHSSSLWKTIDISRILSRPDPPATLKSRLQLAHSTNLDVVLSVSDNSGDGCQLLQILETVGLDQWRSLVLKVTFFYQRYGQHSAPEGSLSGLRSLVIDTSKAGGSCEGTWTSMLNLVGKTASNLRSFTLSNGGIPKTIAHSDVLCNVVSLNIPNLPTEPLLSLANIKKLELTSYNGRIPFELPSITLLRNCSFEYLIQCTFNHVTELTVSFAAEPKNQHPPIEMPELLSLSLKGADVFVCLLDLIAPKLVKLELIDDELPINQKAKNKVRSKELRNHTRGATDAFDTNKERLHIEPFELKLNLILDRKSTLLVLSSWPQLQRLEFWDPRFRLEKSFIKSFCEIDWIDKNSQQRVLSTSSSSGFLSLSMKLELPPLPVHSTVICPDLVCLQVFKVHRDDRDMEWWKEMAEKIMKARVSLGLTLREIFWTSDSAHDRVRVESFV